MDSIGCDFILRQGKRKGSACNKKAYAEGKCHAHYRMKPKRALYRCGYENRKGDICNRPCNDEKLCAKHGEKMKTYRKNKYEENKDNIKKKYEGNKDDVKKKYEENKNDIADKYHKKKIEQIKRGDIFFPRIYIDRYEHVNNTIRGIHGRAKMFKGHIEGYADKHNKGYIFPYHQKFRDPENINHKLYYDDHSNVLSYDQIVINLKHETETLRKQFERAVFDRSKLMDKVNAINENADKYSITMHFLPDKRKNKPNFN